MLFCQNAGVVAVISLIAELSNKISIEHLRLLYYSAIMMNTEPNKNYSPEIYRYISKTPLVTLPEINNELNTQLFFKSEHLQETGSFKFRGAMNFALNITGEEKSAGICISSSGNFAIAIVTACNLLNIKINEMILPVGVKPSKLSFIKKFCDAKIIYYTPEETRQSKIEEIKNSSSSFYIAPSDDERFCLGYQTLVEEIQEAEGDVDYILFPVGTGGLISASALQSRRTAPVTRIIGCEPANIDDAYRSFRAGELCIDNRGVSIADGLVENISQNTFSVINRNVDDIIIVTEEEIIGAVDYLKHKCNLNVEPSSAVPMAALLKYRSRFEGRKVVIVLTGGNHEKVTPSELLGQSD